MVTETGLYDILSVAPSVTTEEISRAYKRLALKCHPDKTNHDPILTEKFKEMTRAYEILKDPATRSLYDEYGERGFSGGTPSSQAAQPPPRSFRPAFERLAYSATNIFSQVFENINDMFARDPGVHFGAGFAMNPMALGLAPDFDISVGGIPTSRHAGLFAFNRRNGRANGPPAGPASPPPKPVRGTDIHHTCKVELRDLYFGRIIKLALPKNSKCQKCNGAGGSTLKSCGQCQGLGRVTTSYFDHHSTYLQSSPCRPCRGSGTFIENQNICSRCAGAGYRKENKIIKVNILPGTKDGDRVVLSKEADEGPNIIPGDVIIHVCEIPHPRLIRKYNDLYLTQEIDLRTALVGGHFIVENFLKQDQSLKVYVNVHGYQALNDSDDPHLNKGQVVGLIRPGEPKLIKGLGMPINNLLSHGEIYQSSDNQTSMGDLCFDLKRYHRGNLFINFQIRMPTMDDIVNGEAGFIMLANALKKKNDDNVEASPTGLVLEAFLTNLLATSTSSFSAAGSSPSKPVEISGDESGSEESGSYDYTDIDGHDHAGDEEEEDAQYFRNNYSDQHELRKRQKI